MSEKDRGLVRSRIPNRVQELGRTQGVQIWLMCSVTVYGVLTAWYIPDIVEQLPEKSALVLVVSCLVSLFGWVVHIMIQYDWL